MSHNTTEHFLRIDNQHHGATANVIQREVKVPKVSHRRQARWGYCLNSATSLFEGQQTMFILVALPLLLDFVSNNKTH
jgi:hypothetical protein